jgi:hypothetical protein
VSPPQPNPRPEEVDSENGCLNRDKAFNFLDYSDPIDPRYVLRCLDQNYNASKGKRDWKKKTVKSIRHRPGTRLRGNIRGPGLLNGQE